VGVIWRVERKPPAIGEVSEAYEELDERGSAGASATAVALVLVGVALMIVGGTIAVAGAERVVDSLGIADSAVGLPSSRWLRPRNCLRWRGLRCVAGLRSSPSPVSSDPPPITPRRRSVLPPSFALYRAGG
jgi:hypothetical protein